MLSKCVAAKSTMAAHSDGAVSLGAGRGERLDRSTWRTDEAGARSARQSKPHPRLTHSRQDAALDISHTRGTGSGPTAAHSTATTFKLTPRTEQGSTVQCNGQHSTHHTTSAQPHPANDYNQVSSRCSHSHYHHTAHIQPNCQTLTSHTATHQPRHTTPRSHLALSLFLSHTLSASSQPVDHLSPSPPTCPLVTRRSL